MANQSQILRALAPIQPHNREERRAHLIARHWRGWTQTQNADIYENPLKDRILPGLKSIFGCRGGYLLRSDGTDEVEFVVISFFDSLAAVQRLLAQTILWRSSNPKQESCFRELTRRQKPEMIRMGDSPATNVGLAARPTDGIVRYGHNDNDRPVFRSVTLQCLPNSILRKPRLRQAPCHAEQETAVFRLQ